MTSRRDDAAPADACVVPLGPVVPASRPASPSRSTLAVVVGPDNREVAQALVDVAWDWDLSGASVWWSASSHVLLGGDASHWLVQGLAWTADVHPLDRARICQSLKAALDGASGQWQAEFRIVRHDGRSIRVSARARIFRGGDGAAERVVGGLTDVSPWFDEGIELAGLSRARRMLQACNESLIRADSEEMLLRGVCTASVEIGGYAMAWVGYALEDAAKSIEVIAHAGDNADFMKGIAMSWAPDGPNGLGPAARTIRTGELIIVEDIGQDPSFAPWLDDLVANGFRGVACLPLRDARRTFGFFYLYAPDVVRIGPDEVALLQELANNLAFGIGNLRSRAQQQRLQAAVLKAAMAVSAASGEAFFARLSEHMADAVGARAAFVARLRNDKPFVLDALASVVDGKAIPNLQYPIRGTPAERLLTEPTLFVSELPSFSGKLRSVLGARLPTACAGVRIEDSSGALLGVIVALFDAVPPDVGLVHSTLQIFAARAASEIERQDADRRLRRQASLLNLAQDAIVVYGMDRRVQFWNHGAERLYGWRDEELGPDFRVTSLHRERAAFDEALTLVCQRGEWSGELDQTRRDGSSITVGARWTLVRDERGQAEAILAIHTDFTDRKKAEHEIQQLAFYDPLTQLPNRLLLMNRLQHALAAEQRTGRGGALLFIDLDNFKTLNDTLGHAMGDLLLQQVASRLLGCVREVDTVARLGGDEFVVMLEDLSPREHEMAMQARSIGEKILAALSVPYQLLGNEHVSTSSIGIAPFKHFSDSVGELLKQADIAMYQAKAAGRNTLRFFDPGLQAAVTARAALEADLRLALAQDELRLHYQPQVDAAGRVTGVEALVRWPHTERGAIAPADFIPLAEDTGMILQLGRWVLHEACQQLAAWAPDARTAVLTMAVNVSSRQFRHPDFVDQVATVLRQTKADARLLKLELTESLLIEDMDMTVGKMSALRAFGLGFALDDFGTGYSSLSYLRKLPLDQLKIDQSFVREVVHDANDAAIVRTIIGLAASLGLEVLAEGVETKEQRDFLSRAGCSAYQGYLFSQPVSAASLVAMLATLDAQADAAGATSTRQS
jgi:diguanylate cyclase (GGDEF)-like protein/PAS domain S-box-containing protein